MDIASILTDSVANNLHFISFGLLILAGFNIPISEDLVFIISASIAAAVIPENRFLIFAGCFLGAYFSDIIAYSIGRHGLTLIQKLGFLKSKNAVNKIDSVQKYFKKYGGMTLFFGRFIPFGVRNIIFLTAGLVKYRIPRFMFFDFIALTITSSILFITGYKFGQNIDAIKMYLLNYKIAVFILFITFILLVIKFLKKNI